MGFTLRLLLEIILVLSSCYISNCAVSGRRHTRQIPPPEVSSSEDVSIPVNETISDDLKKLVKNEVVTEIKPKTESVTEKILNRKNVDSRYKEKLTVETSSEDDGRSESGRAIDISKYVSEEFHNKNNVYTVPGSPDTEKYTKYENVLPDYEHSKLEVTTKYDFDKTYQNIANGVNQKLQHIDEKFSTREDEFKQPQETDVSDILKQSKNNTTQNFNYSRFKNLTTNTQEDGNKKHGDQEVISGQNLDFKSSYRNTQSLADKNLNLANNEVINATLTTEKNQIDENSQSEDFDSLKENSSSKKGIIRNESEIQKSLLSNNIETDTSSLLKWDYVIPSTQRQSPTSTQSSTRSGQEENAIYVPYQNKSAINVSKRGSTRFSDTTSSKPVVSVNKKMILADKANATLEQAVQENQVYPVQIPPPENNQNTTEKTVENSPFYKRFSVLTSTQSVIQNVIEVTNKSDMTTEYVGSAETATDDEKLTTTEDIQGGVTETDDHVLTTTPLILETTWSTLQKTEPSTTGEENYSLTSGSEEYVATSEEQTFATSEEQTYKATTSYEQTSQGVTASGEQAEVTGTTALTYEDISTTPDENYQSDQRTSGRDFGSSYEPTLSEQQTTSVEPETTSTSTESNFKFSNTNQQIVLANATESSTSSTTEWFSPISTTEDVVTEFEPQFTVFPTWRNVKPRPYETTTDDKPLIIPLNISSGGEPDNTDLTTDGGLSSENPEDEEETSAGKIAAIVISSIGAVCLVVLAGLLFIMRKRHKRFNYGQRCTPVSLDAYSVDNVSVYNSVRRKAALRASKRSYGNPAFDDPSITSNPLNFSTLAKFASNLEGISKEFEEVPQVTAQTSELPEGCDSKNRYANVIPLPETRVFLSAVDGYPNSDYINANYVTGPKSAKRYYIACQAPIQSTIDDFWKMVWEQQSKVILMLTHLFENGSEKCVDYLPPSEVLDCHRLFGDYHVTLKKREVREKYVISSLHLKNMVSNSWREVTHLWYLGWPEKGVPSEANSLIAFLIEARSYIKAMPSSENGKPLETTSISNGSVAPDQSPVIVHCSPGTGRTGTVIACDNAIREFELTRQVDIPKTVYRIRRDRASSVQTKEQYSFIYEVITLYATKLTGGVLDSL